jgi:hypothetical protein
MKPLKVESYIIKNKTEEHTILKNVTIRLKAIKFNPLRFELFHVYKISNATKKPYIEVSFFSSF